MRSQAIVSFAQMIAVRIEQKNVLKNLDQLKKERSTIKNTANQKQGNFT
jgi:hypothetical protein